MTLAWRPPSLWTTPRDEALWNAFISHAGEAVPLRGDAEAVFDRTERPNLSRRCVAMDVRGGMRLLVQFEHFPFQSVFGVELSTEDLPNLPAALDDALMTGMAAFAWDALPDPEPDGFAIAGIDTVSFFVDGAKCGDWEWFSIVIRGMAPEPLELVVGCERSLLLDALSSETIVPRRNWPDLKSRLSTPVDFTVGSLRTSFDELRRLMPGAIVAMAAADEDLWSVRAGCGNYTFQQAEEGWTCISADHEPPLKDTLNVGSGDDVMDAGTSKPLEPELTSVGDLPVVIDFDLKRISMPLSEVESWQAGSLVALDPPGKSGSVEVTIRANGAVIGSGDLVRIDERLAVRITRLAFGT
jgi:flagellar motor switch/type III secretory pathway protein FliN